MLTNTARGIAPARRPQRCHLGPLRGCAGSSRSARTFASIAPSGGGNEVIYGSTEEDLGTPCRARDTIRHLDEVLGITQAAESAASAGTQSHCVSPVTAAEQPSEVRGCMHCICEPCMPAAHTSKKSQQGLQLGHVPLSCWRKEDQAPPCPLTQFPLVTLLAVDPPTT